MSDAVAPYFVATPTLGLNKPTVDGDVDIWGDLTNENWDVLDKVLYYTATGGSVSRWAEDRAADIINVVDFGAVADGGATDSTGPFNRAIAAAAGIARVYVPPAANTYRVTTLALPSNTHLIIDGTIQAFSGQIQPVLTMTHGVGNILIEGAGTIDGNNTSPGGIYSAQSCSNIRISGVTVQNASTWNLNITQTSHARVNNVRLLGGVNANEFAMGCDDCIISNSLIDGVSNDQGFSFYGGVTNSSIIGCVVRNNPRSPGICVYADAAQPAACANIVIANNHSYNNGWGGISVFRGNGTSAVHSGVTITGNRCYNNNRANVTYADVWVATGTQVTVAGNTLGPSGNGANPTYGVFVGVNSPIVSVTGNTILNEGQGGTAGSGVYIQTAPDVLVSGNVIVDNQTTKTMASGISGNAGNRNVIVANKLSPFIGAGITLVPISDTVITDGGTATTPLTALAGIRYSASGHRIAFTWGGSGNGLVPVIDDNNVPPLVQSTDAHAIFFTQVPGTGTVSLTIDTTALGNMLTDHYMLNRPNAANDAAAATAGVPVGGVYRNGSVLQVRVA